MIFLIVCYYLKNKNKSKRKTRSAKKLHLQTTSKTGSHDGSNVRFGTILQHDNKVLDVNKAMLLSQSCVLKIFIRDKILFP